jgi:hypothetical protein
MRAESKVAGQSQLPDQHRFAISAFSEDRSTFAISLLNSEPRAIGGDRHRGKSKVDTEEFVNP